MGLVDLLKNVSTDRDTLIMYMNSVKLKATNIIAVKRFAVYRSIIGVHFTSGLLLAKAPA